MIQVSERWKELQPDSSVGILVLKNSPNLPDHPELSRAKTSLESELRSRYGEMDRKKLREEPALAAYDVFYRKFRKSYHVQLQLESVVFKGKEIFSPSALVTCMFMAELKTGLLTAAHDLLTLELPLEVEVSRGDETYLKLDGTDQQLKEGDLFIKDQLGILSSVIYGPDRRTQIHTRTDQAVFTTYAPPGISHAQVEEELEILEGYVRLFAPDCIRELRVVLP